MAEQLLYTAAANFEAVRCELILPDGHRSQKLHDHSFLAEVRCALPEGWTSFPGGEVDELREKLIAAISPLDYSDLNRELEQPADENLARWIRSRLAIPGIDSIGVQRPRFRCS